VLQWQTSRHVLTLCNLLFYYFMKVTISFQENHSNIDLTEVLHLRFLLWFYGSKFIKDVFFFKFYWSFLDIHSASVNVCVFLWRIYEQLPLPFCYCHCCSYTMSVLHKQNQSIDSGPTHTMCNFRAPLHAVLLHQVASTNCSFCRLFVFLLLLSSHRCCGHGWRATDICYAKTHYRHITMLPTLLNY